MKRVTRFQCETCRNLYTTEEGAWTCEGSHLNIKPLSALTKEQVTAIAEHLSYSCTNTQRCPMGSVPETLQTNTCPFGITSIEYCKLPKAKHWISVLQKEEDSCGRSNTVQM